MFDAQAQWVVDQAATRNIQIVIHEGDVTNNTTDAQFINGKASMDILQTANFPNLIAPGNHDYTGSAPYARIATLFNSYFPQSRYTGKAWFDGGFYDATSENVYTRLRVGNYSYLLFVLEYDARAEVLAWVDGIIETVPANYVIMVTHDYLLPTTNERSNPGISAWETFKKHNNVLLIGSGHALDDGQGNRSDMANEGNFVHQFICNYQAIENGGNGYLRIVKIKPGRRAMYATSYSPVADAWKTDAENQYFMTWAGSNNG